MSVIKQALKKAESTPIALMNKLSIQFAHDIEVLRKKRGLKKKELAKKVGVSPAYMTKVMQGEANPTLETMAKFAHALEADMNVGVHDKTSLSRMDHRFFKGQLKSSCHGQDTFSPKGAFLPE